MELTQFEMVTFSLDPTLPNGILIIGLPMCTGAIHELVYAISLAARRDVGPISLVRVPHDTYLGCGYGWSIVFFDDTEDAKNAVEKLRCVSVDGRDIAVTVRRLVDVVMEKDEDGKIRFTT
jgi:hypothetical protein